MLGPLSNTTHEKFAQLVASGMGKKDALLAARDARKPPLKTDAAVRQSASNLMRIPAVRSRIAEIQDQMLKVKLDAAREREEQISLTRDWVIERLMENANRAMQATAVLGRDGEPTGEYKYDGSVANRALELLGKELGMFIERTENLNTNYAISDEPATEAEWAERHTAH